LDKGDTEKEVILKRRGIPRGIPRRGDTKKTKREYQGGYQ